MIQLHVHRLEINRLQINNLYKLILTLFSRVLKMAGFSFLRKQNAWLCNLNLKVTKYFHIHFGFTLFLSSNDSEEHDVRGSLSPSARHLFQHATLVQFILTYSVSLFIHVLDDQLILAAAK